MRVNAEEEANRMREKMDTISRERERYKTDFESSQQRAEQIELR